MADDTEVAELKARIEKLTPPDRLRLAADLLEAGRLDLAERVASVVVEELLMLRLFAPMKDHAHG